MRKESIGSGIILTVVSMFFIASMDATGKFLSQNFPIIQILSIRFVIFFTFALVMALRVKHRSIFRSQMPLAQIIRSLVLAIEVSVFIFAFSLMPLADAHAIAAVAPLIGTMLAGLILGEAIGLRRWISVAIGFVGALVIIRPGMGVMSWTAVIPLAGAFLWAGYQVLSRRVALGDRPETTALYTAFVGMVIFGVMAPFVWQSATTFEWSILILNGVLGSIGHIILLKALDVAPASALQPFNYALLLWAILIGYVVFSDLPDILTFVGAGIVVFGGLLASDQGQQWMRRFR
jgi:drug/metabolite transporter (DMT)-like permease